MSTKKLLNTRDKRTAPAAAKAWLQVLLRAVFKKQIMYSNWAGLAEMQRHFLQSLSQERKYIPFYAVCQTPQITMRVIPCLASVPISIYNIIFKFFKEDGSVFYAAT